VLGIALIALSLASGIDAGITLAVGGGLVCAGVGGIAASGPSRRAPASQRVVGARSPASSMVR
jgi:hypothetical protein